MIDKSLARVAFGMAIELDRLECKGVVTLGEFKCDALHGGSGAMLDGGLERQGRGDPHHHRAEGFVADVEIVVGEAAALASKDTIIGILGWVFRHVTRAVGPCSSSWECSRRHS